MSNPPLHNTAHEQETTIHAAGRNPGTGRSIHSWRRSIRERKTHDHPRFTPDQSGGILAETGRSRSGIARIGSSAVEELDAWLGAQDPDCCNGGFEGTKRNEGPSLDRGIMKRKSDYYPPFKDEGEVMASWGEARLIKYLDGKTELRGGSDQDRCAWRIRKMNGRSA